MTHIKTRFAPSPTGFLHLGGARTALFNWLFAKHHGGECLLRMEDTDQKRSKTLYEEDICVHLKWLNLQWDQEIVKQSQRKKRHQEIAYHLLEKGHAYYCTCSKDDLEQSRQEAQKQGKHYLYDRRCREAHHSAQGQEAVLRFTMPLEGSVTIHDQVQNTITIENKQRDDLILLRSDHTPTYNLSVVVDDHDMAITHIIRGTDHLSNTFRQEALYRALGWEIPNTAHIPLIHDAQGRKLSKRDQVAQKIAFYKKKGYLPEAMLNTLVRLGWSHGNNEIFSIQKAIKWFSLKHVGRSPSRFDEKKLNHLNAYYLRQESNQDTVKRLKERKNLPPEVYERLESLLSSIKSRSINLEVIEQQAKFLQDAIPMIQEDASALLHNTQNILAECHHALEHCTPWTHDVLERTLRNLAQEKQYAFKNIAQPIRVCLTGSCFSPGLFDILLALGKKHTLKRIKHNT